MAKNLIAFTGGVYASFQHFLGNTYTETALKGLIGGLMGYLGTVLMTWIVKNLKQKIDKNQKR